MKKLFLITVLSLVVITTSFAQEKETKKINATEVAKTRGANPNIKTDFVCDAPDVAVEKPAATRGSYCTINFDNYTGYSVKVYVDGDFYGWVSPWDEGSVTVYSGYTTVYAITSGGTYEWSADGNCSTYYNFELHI